MPHRLYARGVSTGAHRPAVIAHGAGNTPRTVRDAIEAGADFVEVDLWVHRGRFEARHERRLPFSLPVLFDNWYVKFTPRRRFGLTDLLREVAGRCGLFLDLKNGGEDAALLVRRALDAARVPSRLVASSQSWETLRDLRRVCPEVAVFFSVDVEAKLELFRSVSDHDQSADGVSCRHTLLSPGLIADFHARELQVVAWTVDEPARAAELAAWGVDGIATGVAGSVCTAFERDA